MTVNHDAPLTDMAAERSVVTSYDQESPTIPTVVDGVDTHRVFMTSAEIQFFTDASLSETQDCYYTLRGGKVADITYTDETMQDVIDTNRAESQAVLEQAEALLANYTEDAGYQYTILYCHTKDGEIVNTPSYWIQPFFFELFKEWGLME